MNEKMVSKKLKDLPPLTEADRERLAVLAARPDSEIDRSDMPELTEEDWKTAVRGKHYRPVKAQITAHLDKDVLAWLKADGTRISNPYERHPSSRNASGALVQPATVKASAPRSLT